MKTRTAVRIISFCLAAVIFSFGFLLKATRKNNRYSMELQNSYSKNFDDFSAAVNNISLTLQKLRHASTKEAAARFASTLLAEAEISKSALSQMPQNGELTVLNRFFSQVGNYAMAVAKSLASDSEALSAAGENLSILADAAKKIAEATNTSYANYNNDAYWATELEAALSGNTDPGLAESLSELESELTDFPTLIYDGPYSDHLLTKEPALLKGAKAITQAEALEAASLFCETAKEDLTLSSESQGKIPAFVFEGNNISCAVSRMGGHTVYMRKYRDIGKEVLSINKAREKANRYLNQVGMNNLRETYYYLNEGVLLINYCFLDGATLCYTDLVKVGVAMDNGEIVMYEAAGYIANHHERAFLSAEYTKEQAAELLNPNLTITGSGIALIPTNSGGEVRCYEFACTAKNGDEILVFINLSTLKEEDILILLKSDGGTLVK